MTFADVFAKRDEYCVWLDSKAGVEEALHALREDCGRQHAFVHDEKLDGIVDNYAGEPPEEQMQALGQQCTVYGMALYSLERGDNEYGLFLVAQNDMAAFEAYAENNGHNVAQLKQARKKFGSASKKIKHDDTLLLGRFKLPENSHIEFAGDFAANQIKHYDAQGVFSHKSSVSYNLAVWPPKKQINKEIINKVACNPEFNMWAAVFGEENAEAKLKLTQNPFDKKSWLEVPFPETPDLEKWAADPAYRHYHGDVLDVATYPMWVGPDLLLAYIRRHKPGSFASVTHVWAVPNAAKGATACRKIMVTPPCRLAHGEQPGLAHTQAQTYVLLAGRFYAWLNGELKDTGMEALTHTEFDAVSTGPHSFAYVAEGRLVEIDMLQNRSRFRELRHMDHKASIHQLDAEWAVVLRYGYTNAALDIAQFWRIGVDEWRRLKLGAFGKEGICRMVRLSDGAFLAQTISELCKINDLWGFLAGKNDTALTMPPWSEDWSPEAPADATADGDVGGSGAKGGLWGKLKRFLGF